MSCNCKAVSHIVRTKKQFGYEMPTRKNVKVSERIKTMLQALLIWFVIIIFLPIVLIVLIFGKIFKKDITFFKKIKVRL